MEVGTYNKPLPQVKPWSKPFWEGTRRGEFLIQVCTQCKEKIFYPKYLCPKCMNRDFTWEPATGRGTVYSFSVVHRHAPSSFADSTPYVLAIIRLEEGVQLLSNLVEINLDEIHCDMPVELVLTPITEEFTLPFFRPRRP